MSHLCLRRSTKRQAINEPLPEVDPRQRQPDISLASSELGWQPRVTLDDGLKETIAYFRKLLAESDIGEGRAA